MYTLQLLMIGTRAYSAPSFLHCFQKRENAEVATRFCIKACTNATALNLHFGDAKSLSIRKPLWLWQYELAHKKVGIAGDISTAVRVQISTQLSSFDL